MNGTIATSARSLDRLKPGLIPWLLFFAVALTHSFSSVKHGGDPAWSLHTAMSILTEGNTDLVEYEDMIDPLDYRLEWIEGRPYTIFPLGPSLFALPVVAILDGVLRLARGESYAQELRHGHRSVERVIASLLVGLTAVLLYRSGRRWPASRTVALTVALLLAFATPAWSTASRALWSHTPSLLMLSCAVLLWIRGEDEPRLVPWIALPLALSFLCRPTQAVPILVFTVFMALRHLRRLPEYLGIASLVAVPWIVFNLNTYGAPLPWYFQPSRLGAGSHFGTALLGNLVSPARGLLVYSPFVALSTWGAILAWRERRHRDLIVAAVMIVVGHWLLISTFPHWWGGHSYGPRFFTEVMPLPVLLLVPVLQHVKVAFAARRILLPGVLFVLVTWSVCVHAVGATIRETKSWNSLPVDVDHNPQRLWDWSDPPFLRWRSPEA